MTYTLITEAKHRNLKKAKIMSNLSIDKRDLICNKSSCLRIAAQVFLKNKRTARVCIEEFSRNVFITYTGARDLESIVEGMKVQRVIER